MAATKKTKPTSALTGSAIITRNYHFIRGDINHTTDQVFYEIHIFIANKVLFIMISKAVLTDFCFLHIYAVDSKSVCACVCMHMFASMCVCCGYSCACGFCTYITVDRAYTVKGAECPAVCACVCPTACV